MSRVHDDETRELYDRAARLALSALEDLGKRAPASLRAAFAELRAAVFEPEPDSLPATAGGAGRELLDYFREETGLTPLGFLRECRLETMAWLLVISDLSVAEIGERVGYLVAAGRTAEAAELARELIATLESSGLAPDTLDAIRALRGALRQDALTLEELKPLRRIVAALERDVKARRGPAFEL